jgi:hypothetical protein
MWPAAHTRPNAPNRIIARPTDCSVSAAGELIGQVRSVTQANAMDPLRSVREVARRMFIRAT